MLMLDVNRPLNSIVLVVGSFSVSLFIDLEKNSTCFKLLDCDQSADLFINDVITHMTLLLCKEYETQEHEPFIKH